MLGCLENTDQLENTDHRPQTLKTQTSQFKVSLKTYAFDENSLLMALIFPIVYGLDGMPTLLFFFAVWRLSIAIAGLATRTGNSQT